MLNEKYIKYAKDLLDISAPTFIFFILFTSRNIINIAFISNTYQDYRLIEALGLVDLYINITLNIVITGITGGIEILGSNYFGDKNYVYLGITVMKAKLIALTYYIMITIFNILFAEALIVFFFHIKDDIVIIMRPYLYLSMIYMFLNIALAVDFRYLSIIGKSHVNTLTLLTTALIQPFINYILITFFNLSLLGCGISLVLLQILSVFGLTLYIHYYDPCPGSNVSINKKCFEDWFEYINICIPTTLIVLAEWMGYELQAIIVMHYSGLHYSIHIIFVNVQLLIFNFTLSCNISMSINIAQKIMHYSTEKLREFIKIADIINKLIVCSLIFLLHLFKEPILKCLTTGVEMKEIAIDTISIMYIYLFLDNGHFFFAGILKGLAYLIIPATVTMINFYVIQITLSLFFCLYLQLGVKGIWISLTIGTLLSYSSYFYMFSKLDLEQKRAEALKRVEKNRLIEDKHQMLIDESNGKLDSFKDDFIKNSIFQHRRSRIYNDDL